VQFLLRGKQSPDILEGRRAFSLRGRNGMLAVVGSSHKCLRLSSRIDQSAFFSRQAPSSKLQGRPYPGTSVIAAKLRLNGFSLSTM
jgi:hypothetical protein